jgi:hypothetical protein
MAAKPSPDYDIFPRLAAFLDTHLTFPVLSFVESLEVGRCRLQVARKGTQHLAHTPRPWRVAGGAASHFAAFTTDRNIVNIPRIADL